MSDEPLHPPPESTDPVLNTGNQVLVGTPAAGTQLAGDVTGTTSAATVAKVQGKGVAVPAPADDTKFLQYNNSTGLLQWANASAGAAVTMGGDVSGASSAASVDKARGTPLPTPAAGDDQKLLAYVSGSTAYGLRTAPLKVATKSAGYTLTADDMAILADASGGSLSITLPAVAGTTHRTYWVKKKDATANTVTIQANAAETIDGANTAVLSVPYSSLTLLSDGSAWWLV